MKMENSPWKLFLLGMLSLNVTNKCFSLAFHFSVYALQVITCSFASHLFNFTNMHVSYFSYLMLTLVVVLQITVVMQITGNNYSSMCWIEKDNWDDVKKTH
ncbi:hypothetical protein HPP92_027919 [Vanilla planifolia]|uniref:Uncharacterized protein n=1 Tax=Vanilla planifolia TaxID=51239 RepID=A0A835PAR8_VANPL|nr:hypothetical protein HPP92_027919 [Vanilla planifolia]